MPTLALPPDAALVFLLATLPFCLWAFASDIRSMKIRNKAVLGLAAAYLVTGPFVLPTSIFLWHIAYGVLALGVGFLLNMIGALGAGDAKFIAAAVPFFMPGDAAFALYLLAFVLVVAFALHRLCRAIPVVRRATPHWQSWTAKKFPMGTALGPTLILYFLLALA